MNEKEAIRFLIEHRDPNLNRLGLDASALLSGSGRPGKKRGGRWWDGMLLLVGELKRLQGGVDMIAATSIADAIDDKQRKDSLARCMVTKKVIFRSEAEARANRGKNRKKDRLRAYLCNHCYGYHLTSSVGSGGKVSR